MTLTRVDITPRERELAETCFHEAGHAVLVELLLNGVSKLVHRQQR